MAEKRFYQETTLVKNGKYLFKVYSAERYLKYLEDWGNISQNNLTQIFSIENIENPFKSERKLIGQWLSLGERDTSDRSDNYASEQHKRLVFRIQYNPWKYLRKIKRKIK